jgi:hypothetical protein
LNASRRKSWSSVGAPCDVVTATAFRTNRRSVTCSSTLAARSARLVKTPGARSSRSSYRDTAGASKSPEGRPRWGLGALALGLGSAAAALAVRRRPTPEPTPADPTAPPPEG